MEFLEEMKMVKKRILY